MKKICILIVIVLIMLMTTTVYALEIPEIEGYAMFSDMARDIAGGSFSMQPTEVLNNLGTLLSSGIREFLATAVIILVMALLSSTVTALNSAVGDKPASTTAFFTFFTVISGLALTCFSKALGYGTEVIGYMTAFMSKLTPIIIVTLFACCKSASAAAFEPVLSAAVFVASEIVEHCLIPLITFSAVLAVAGNVGDKNRISGFVKIIKSASKWIMTLVITVFTGINTIYGFTSPAIDAVGTKTVKFAVGSLVPMVGGFLSDTLDTVTASAGVMKNAVGVSGIVIVTLIAAVPVIKIGVMQLMLKLISAVVEPICDRRISSMLWDMSEALTTVFSVVVLTAVLFIINVCIILRATG